MLTNRAHHNLLDRPSSFEAGVEKPTRNAESLGPIKNRKPFTIPFQITGRLLVILLLPFGRPPAVFGRISFVVVSSLQCHSRRPDAHSFQEPLERSPLFAGHNPAASIPAKPCKGRIETPAHHIFPDGINSALFRRAFMDPGGGALAGPVASAMRGRSGNQIRARPDYIRSAVTFHIPANRPIFVPVFAAVKDGDGDQLSKSSPCQILGFSSPCAFVDVRHGGWHAPGRFAHGIYGLNLAGECSEQLRPRPL